jgi:hypothetical protein
MWKLMLTSSKQTTSEQGDVSALDHINTNKVASSITGTTLIVEIEIEKRVQPLVSWKARTSCLW